MTVEPTIPEAVPGIIVLPRPPLAETGTGQRSLLLIEAAAQLGPVHVVMIDDGAPLDALQAISGVASVTTLPSRKLVPRSPLANRLVGPSRLVLPDWAYAPDPAFRAALRAHVTQTGARYMIFRYSWPFCAAGMPHTPDCAMLVDVDDRDDLKYASRLENLPGQFLTRTLLARVRRVLERRLSEASHVWFAGAGDVLPLATSVSVLPNVPHALPDIPPDLDPAACTALFVGTFVHQPNRDGLCWFLDTAWADIVARVPGAQLRVVGFGDWASLAPRYAHLQGVEFVGGVDDLAAEYARATVAICPMREGAGSNIKMIEAAGYARPIVATSFALRGFDEALPDLVRCADSPAGLAEACAAYLAAPQEAARDGLALRAAQQRHYHRAAVQARIQNDISATLTQQASAT